MAVTNTFENDKTLLQIRSNFQGSLGHRQDDGGAIEWPAEERYFPLLQSTETTYDHT